MEQGKVILIGGTKRAGKTTLSMLLHKNHVFNYLNFDHIEDAIDIGINKIDGYNTGENFLGFLEEMIDFSLKDAENYGINTVLDTYMYSPSLLSQLRNKDKIEVYYLADLDITEDKLRENLKYHMIDHHIVLKKNLNIMWLVF